MEGFGFISTIPLLVMLIMTVTTKRVFESMIVSLIIVFVIKDGTGFLNGFINGFYDVLAEGTYSWAMLMIALLGGFIALLIGSGATHGFRKFAEKFVKSRKSCLIFTWILGLIIFIDDYINNLGIGPSVRGLADKHKIPREQIGFIVCSMGTPVCALFPFTVLAVFVFGIMQDYGVSPEGSSIIVEYSKIIPYLFYPMAIIVVSGLLAAGILPKIGPLKKYYAELELKANKNLEANEVSENTEIEETGSVVDFALPVITVLVTIFATSDFVTAVCLGIVVCFVLYIPRKKMNIDLFFKKLVDGILDMGFILMLILMIFIFVSATNEIGFSEYIIDTISPYLVGGTIPVLTFVTVAVLGFLGVDYWAVILLMTPIAIPLANEFMVNPYVAMAAVVSGALFGATACLFSEQILMCAHSVEREPAKLALTGLPYSIMAFVIAVILYLIFGFII